MGNGKIEISNSSALAKILKLEHRVAALSRTFYLLRQQK